jgi:hypothetical protein
MSLVVNMTGEIQILTSIGISFFNPENDTRSPDRIVQCATVNAWQKVNLGLQQVVISKLKQLGWNHSF